MGEDPGDHRGLFDGADDLQGATTLATVLEVDPEHTLQQARPTPARRRTLRLSGIVK